jgi:hypothetical protein
MRKAFDSNVAKLRPRLKGGTASATAEPELALPEPTPVAAVTPPVAAEAPPGPVEAAGAEVIERAVTAATTSRTSGQRQPARRSAAAARPAATMARPEQESVAMEPVSEAPRTDLDDRKARLEKIKRKVAEAARPTLFPAPPPTPTAASESALSMVRDLEGQLSRARDVEEALRGDLLQARAELARTAADAKGALDRLSGAEKLLDEKCAVMGEMLAEMKALEEERDQSVQRSQALSALDQERQQVLDEVTAQLDEVQGAYGTATAEVSRLSEELDTRGADAARLRKALAEVTRERDQLARETIEARRERDELLEARKALEKVHVALSSARSKLGY